MLGLSHSMVVAVLVRVLHGDFSSARDGKV